MSNFPSEYQRVVEWTVDVSADLRDSVEYDVCLVFQVGG